MLVICLIVFTATVPVSIILPMLPYIGRTYGATPFEVSLLFALMPAITIFVAPLWGRLSDRIGRKPVFLITLAASGVAFAIFGYADSLSGMFFARFIQGLANGSVAIAYAMVADVSDNNSRARSIGYLSAAMAMGFFLGPVLGGLFLPGGDAPFDQAPAAYFAAALCMAATALGAWMLPETRRIRAAVAAPDAAASPETRPATGASRATMAFLIAQFLIAGFTSATCQFAFAYWTQGAHGWAPNSVSFGLSAIGVAYLISTLGLIGPLTRKFGDERTFLIGAMIDISGMALFLLGHADVHLGIAGILISIAGNGTWSTVLSSVLSKLSPPEQTGLMLGISNGANMVGRVLGPLASGLLLSEALTAPFAANLVLTVVVLAGAIRVVVLARRTPRITSL